MKLHLPVPLLAAVVSAIAAPCVLADTYANVTYKAEQSNPSISTSNVGVANVSTMVVKDADNTVITGPTVSNATLNLANYTESLTLTGSATDSVAQNLATSTALGGYGGRFHLSGASASDKFTINLSGGTEVDMGSVLSSSTNAPALYVDNASFYVATNALTICSNIEVEAGGLRLNGNGDLIYTLTGTITGGGTIACNVKGGSTAFTGDVSGFTGTWRWTSTDTAIRTFKFGAGGECKVAPNSSTGKGVVGGSFGSREDNERLAVEFNYSNAYSISGEVYASTLTITAGDATFSGTIDANTVTVANGASFSLSGATVTGLTMSGSAAISLSGTNTFNATLTANGSPITIADGAVFSSSELSSLVTHDESQTTYSDELDPNSGNGYASGLAYVLIANNSSTASAPSLSNVTTVGELSGTTLEWVAGTGLVAKTHGSSGAYYINEGTVNYSDSSTSSVNKESTTELVLNGGTLVLEKALGVHLTTHGGTVQVNGEIISLNSGNMTVMGDTTLAGNGVYEATGDTISNNRLSHIALATGNSGWTGTVRISNYANENHTLNFSQLANGSLSKVELNGFSGWGAGTSWYGTETTRFILTDAADGTVAWKNGAYSTNSDRTLTFTGKFSGTGTFQIDLSGSSNTDVRMHYTFSGDISDWEGKILKSGKDATRSSVLTFDNEAKNVNVAIENAGGLLNVVAGVDGIAFKKDITATSLAMNDNVNATLEGTATVGTLTLNGGATATLSGDGKVAAGERISFEALKPADASPIATLQEGETGGTATVPTGSISNGGSTAASFSGSGNTVGSTDTTYTNIKAVANSTAAFELQGTLTSSAVVNEGTGAVTVTASGAQDGLYAKQGNITVNTSEATIALRELSIGESKAISATISDIQSKATLSVSEAATFGSGATLNANLELGNNVALTLDGALQMGSSTLTLNQGITLNGALLAELNNLAMGEAVVLFTGVDSLVLNSDTAPATYALETGGTSSDIIMDDKVDLGTYFSNVGQGNYFLVYDSQAGTVSAVAPEPSTATLGLLALAGLCARRRRK